jgi:thioredoxin-dependent peroxiredoxin
VTLRAGSEAPDFTLDGTDGTLEGRRPYRRSEYLGTPVVLVFYPADNSPVCTVQLASYSADIGRFAEVGAQVLAISPQSVEDHDRFAAEQGGFAFPLLADTDKEVGRAYGILGPIGFYRRSVFVIDAEGTIRWSHRATAGLTFRPVDEIVKVVAGLSDA